MMIKGLVSKTSWRLTLIFSCVFYFLFFIIAISLGVSFDFSIFYFVVASFVLFIPELWDFFYVLSINSGARGQMYSRKVCIEFDDMEVRQIINGVAGVSVPKNGSSAFKYKGQIVVTNGDKFFMIPENEENFLIIKEQFNSEKFIILESMDIGFVGNFFERLWLDVLKIKNKNRK